MPTYQVSIEGQTIPLPAEIARDDDSVRRALVPYYPEAANALITRVTKDDIETITVVKRAGAKGSAPSPLAALLAAPAGKNPAIALYEEVESIPKLDALALLELDVRIEAAIQSGEEQAGWVTAAIMRLIPARAIPAPRVILGF